MGGLVFSKKMIVNKKVNKQAFLVGASKYLDSDEKGQVKFAYGYELNDIFPRPKG